MACACVHITALCRAEEYVMDVLFKVVYFIAEVVGSALCTVGIILCMYLACQ